MCILFFTLAHPSYKLIIASNRDEFFDRPSSVADWHSFGAPSNGAPWVLSGCDLAANGGGTWLGMTRDLRIGIITNVRPPERSPAAPRDPTVPSRGTLLRNYLSPQRGQTIPQYVSSLPPLEAFDGFNLMLFQVGRDKVDTGYISNRPAPRAAVIQLDPTGFHGLSNTPIDEPWPKVVQGRKTMEEIIGRAADGGEDALLEHLFGMLRHSIPVESPSDAPFSTAIPPIQIAGRWYGTRVSTIILISNDNEVTFVERDVGAEVGGKGRAVQTLDRTFLFKGTPA